MKRPSDHPNYGKELEIINVKRFLDDVRTVRSSEESTPPYLSLSELLTDGDSHEDPLFAESAPIIDHLRSLPEPFRSKLLAALVSSLPPDHVTNLERLDPELVRLLRHAGGSTETQQSATGLPPHPYMSNVQYSSAYFTAEADPVRHSARHDGRFFAFPEQEQAFLLPEGLPDGVDEEFSVTHRRALMVRAESRQLVHELEAFRLVSRAWQKQQQQQQQGEDVKDSTNVSLPLEPAFGGKAIALATAEARRLAEVRRVEEAGGADRGGATGAAEGLESEAWEDMPESVEAEVSKLALEALQEASPPPGTNAESSSSVAGLRAPSLPLPRVFTGPTGAGKTCALLQVVRYARAHGWLCVYVPSAYHLTHRGRVLTPTRGSDWDFDQNDLATEMLTHLLAAHGRQLEQVKQRGRYALDLFLPEDKDEEVTAMVQRRVEEEEDEVASLKATAEAEGRSFNPAKDWTSKLQQELAAGTSVDRRLAGYTLLDMLEWGLRHPPRATEAMIALLEELRQVDEFPVLVAVDGVNELYEPSGYPAPEGRRLNTRRLPLVRALQHFDAYGHDAEGKGFRRGVFVGAACMARNKRPLLLRETPPGSNANVPPDCRLPLAPLSRGEVHSTLVHYSVTGRFPELPKRGAVDAHAVEVFRALSSGLPREIRKAAIVQW